MLKSSLELRCPPIFLTPMRLIWFLISVLEHVLLFKSQLAWPQLGFLKFNSAMNLN